MLSADGSKAAMYTTSGNLCIYTTYGSFSTTSWNQRWCLGITSNDPNYLYLDYNGILRLVDKSGISYWRSGNTATTNAYSAYLQLKNTGELLLISSWYATSFTLWACGSSAYYGYDSYGSVIYLSSYCASDYSYDPAYCTTTLLGPSAAPTLYPGYDYDTSTSSTSTSTSSSTLTTTLSIVMPVVFGFITIVALCVRNRIRVNTNATVIPYTPTMGSAIGGNTGLNMTPTPVNYGAGTLNNQPTFASQGGIGMGGLGMNSSIVTSNYPVTQPIGSSTMYPRSTTVSSFYPSIGSSSVAVTPSYQPMPQSMSDPQSYGVQMTTLGGGGGGNAGLSGMNLNNYHTPMNVNADYNYQSANHNGQFL
jgi:hypothetical protein